MIQIEEKNLQRVNDALKGIYYKHFPILKSSLHAIPVAELKRIEDDVIHPLHHKNMRELLFFSPAVFSGNTYYKNYLLLKAAKHYRQQLIRVCGMPDLNICVFLDWVIEYIEHGLLQRRIF